MIGSKIVDLPLFKLYKLRTKYHNLSPIMSPLYSQDKDRKNKF
jgi:hypothetical protein